jgi:gamma-glutamylcysteine synthetase
LYTNNLTDLVTLDIQNLADVKEVSRVSNALEPFAEYPPFTNVAFECVDNTKGVIVGWRSAAWPDEDPECRRF